MIPGNLTVMLEMTSDCDLKSKDLSSRMPRERGLWRLGGTYERSDPLLSSEVDVPIRTGTRAVEIHPDRPVLHFLAQAVPINKFVISHEKCQIVESLISLFG